MKGTNIPEELYLEPQGNRILVIPEPVINKTASGIIVTSDQKVERAAMHRGLVLAMGPDCYSWDRATPYCRVGDRVVWAQYAGMTIEDIVTKELYVVINDDDVICTVPVPFEGDYKEKVTNYE